MRKAVLLAFLLIAGCTSDTTTPPEQKNVAIAVPGSTNVAFLSLLAAKQLGYFEDEGLTVEIKDVASGTAARQLVVDGNAEAAIGFYELTIQAQAQGIDVLRNEITVLVDTRTEAATTAVYGGDYPATSLYALRTVAGRNPRTMVALVKGIVRATEWLRTTPPLEIPVKLNFGTDPASRELWVQILSDSKEMFAETAHFTSDDTKRVFDAVTLFDSKVTQANVDLRRTYTNWFVDAAH